jgi:quercetin dioxygenase-like cupin family protein
MRPLVAERLEGSACNDSLERRTVMSTNGRSAFHELATTPLDVVTPSFSKKTIQGEKQMVVWANLKKGGHAAVHSHPEEQFFWITSGCLEFHIKGESFICPAGSVLTVPSFVEHEAIATEDTTFVSFLSGVRKDLLGTTVPKHFNADA